MASPRPVPLGPLVEKKGSKIRRRTESEGRHDHGLRAPHDRPQETFAHGHGPAELRASVIRARANLGGKLELTLVVGGEPDVDERAGHAGLRGAGHALEDLGEARPRAGRLGQFDEGPLSRRRVDRRARPLAGRTGAHDHIPR
jgi:hypothetical protein